MGSHEFMRKWLLEASADVYRRFFTDRSEENLRAVVEDLKEKVPLYLMNFLRLQFPEHLQNLIENENASLPTGFFQFEMKGNRLMYKERFTKKEFDVTERACKVMDVLGEEYESYFEASPETLAEFVRVLESGGAGSHVEYVYMFFAHILVGIYLEEMPSVWDVESEAFDMALDFLRVSSWNMGGNKNREFSQFIHHYYLDIKYKEDHTWRDILTFFAYTPNEFLRFIGFTRQEMVSWGRP